VVSTALDERESDAPLDASASTAAQNRAEVAELEPVIDYSSVDANLFLLRCVVSSSLNDD
jgi:hypothetical protein